MAEEMVSCESEKLFSLTIPNARLKRVLKLHTVLADPQFICGERYPVICGTQDYPSTMEICRLTQLNEYEVASDLSDPETYQAFRLDLEQLDRLLLNVGHTTLIRYREKPNMLEVSQEVHRGQMARGFLEIEEIVNLDRVNLWNHVLLWKTRCAKGIAATDYKEICSQIIGLKLEPDHLLTLTMKKDDLIIDCNSEYGTKIIMQVIKPERWMEIIGTTADGTAITHSHTAAENGDEEAVSIQIAWTHFVKYMQTAKSEIRFYIRKDVSTGNNLGITRNQNANPSY
jgi:hypothetical protein